MRRRRSTLPLRQSTTPESIQSFLLSYPLHFQADLPRNILGLRGALRNSPIGAGLIGGSRRATDVGRLVGIMTFPQPLCTCTCGLPGPTIRPWETRFKSNDWEMLKVRACFVGRGR